MFIAYYICNCNNYYEILIKREEFSEMRYHKQWNYWYNFVIREVLKQWNIHLYRFPSIPLAFISKSDFN